MESAHDYNGKMSETTIPDSFHSFDTDKPFTNCIDCGIDLQNTGVPYFIEKAYKRYKGFSAHDVIYEFAMCLQCAEKMKNEISTESQARMQQFIQENVDSKKRYGMMQEYNPHTDSSMWLNSCMITNEPIDEQEEYVIYGFFRGDRMIVADFPYALGASAMDEIGELLSEKTLGEIDDFMGNHFSGPPEVNELLKPRRPVFF